MPVIVDLFMSYEGFHFDLILWGPHNEAYTMLAISYSRGPRLDTGILDTVYRGTPNDSV